MNKNLSKRTIVRIVLVTILLIIVAFSALGEKVACNDGIGWDGENYYTTMQRFIPMIKHQEYDQYAIRRIMPWGLVDIASALFKFEVTTKVAILSGLIFNIIALVLSVFYYFRISNLKRWKLHTEVLGFGFIFYSYLILKMLGYYPLLTDIFAMTLGIMLCYYFLANKKWALIILGFVGATIWPSSPACAFALAFFPRKPIKYNNEEGPNNILLQILFVAVASIPFVMLMLGALHHNGDIMATMRYICPLTLPLSIWIMPLTCLCACLFYYYLVSAYKFSILEAIKDNFTGSRIWINYILFFMCLLAVSVFYKVFANSSPGLLTPYKALEWTILTSMTDPFVFVENHFIYYSLPYLLMLFFWKEIAKIVMNQGLGYLFMVALWVLFSIRPEARVSILYFIFPVMALLMYIDTKEIRISAVTISTLFMLASSRFWFKINVPNMEKYLGYENFENYTRFPAQRYFLSQGHWQSHEMYYFLTFITIVIAIILCIGIQKKWFVQTQTHSEVLTK